MNSNLDWDGPLTTVKFIDNFAGFKDVKFNRNLCVIVDIKSISFAKLDPTFEDIGFTSHQFEF